MRGGRENLQKACRRLKWVLVNRAGSHSLANVYSQLKRQHSAEPIAEPTSTRKSPHLKNEDSPSGGTPQSINSTSANAGTPPEGMSPVHGDTPEVVGSPFKRHRASMPGLNSGILGPIGSNTNDVFPPSTLAPGPKDDQTRASSTPEVKLEAKVESDEEL